MRQILKDIGLCKSVIINSLLDNQEIMELMLGKKYTDADVENIVYKQIFPYLYIDADRNKNLHMLRSKYSTNPNGDN